MKRISLLLTSLILFFGWVEAQNEKISFNETSHNFGEIGDKDGRVYFDFVLSNNSNEPVVITKVQASCGCTTPSWTREPIEPKKTGTITVSFNPAGQNGSFTKTITVHVSQTTPIYLSIKGKVLPGTLRIVPEELYPVAKGNYLLKKDELNFGNIGLNEAKAIRLEVYNNSDAPITQKTLKLPKYLSVAFNPVIIPANSAATVDVILDVQDSNLYGDLSGEITLMINEVRQFFPYSATVLDDFSQWTAAKKANAGKINISTSEINFGNFSTGNNRTLKISNSGKSILNVRNVQSYDPAITVSKLHFVVNPGEIAEIKINVDKNKVQSNLSSKLLIITDDPNMPVYEISVLAYKKS